LILTSLLSSLVFYSNRRVLFFCPTLRIKDHNTRGLSTSINFLIITLFISLLNSSTNALPLYPLFLTTLLNSCINFYIVFPPCYILLSSAILTNSSFYSLNYFLSSNKNSLANPNSTSPDLKSSNKFSFHISADSPCT